MILVFDRSVAAWFCGNLGFSAEEAQRARMNDRPVDCAQYVAEFRKTVDMLKLFGIDANVETDVAFGKNTLDIIKHAEICKDGERYVIVQDSKIDASVLNNVIFKFAE